MNLIFKLFFFFFVTDFLHGQDVKILKENINIDNNSVELQELQFCHQNKNIYKKVQSTFDLFNDKYFFTAARRLKAKKTLIENLIRSNELKGSQTGFENYTIYFNKNKILNISIGLQVYGSSWESIRYYCFDLEKDKEIGDALFINQQKLMRLCELRLKNGENVIIKQKNLKNYKFELSDRNAIKGISFIFVDSNHRSDSGYQEYLIFFSWKELEKFISPEYKLKLRN